MRAFYVLVGILLGYFIQAQNYKVIEGQVIEASTNQSLPFCSVFIKGEVIGTVANIEGRFKLNIPKTLKSDTLVISHVGYKNYYAIVENLPNTVHVEMEEAPIDLDEVLVEIDRLTAQEVFNKAIEKIKAGEGYPDKKFKMDGFYREVHGSDGERTGVVECAISVFSDDVRKKFKEIAINQFRKVYERKQNTDQFIDTKEGHNHLLLLLNGGINLIPLAKRYKSTVWQLPLEIKELTYFNDRLVYVLANEKQGRMLKLYVDVEDYAIYKNELILEVEDQDHENYVWGRMNSRGEECGAIYDHQGYEYRKIKGKWFPYYSFRRFDFRCFDLKSEEVIASAYLSKELLINDVTFNPVLTATDKVRKKQGMMNRRERYDSTFWMHFNDIQDVGLNLTLDKNDLPATTSNKPYESLEKTEIYEQPRLRIGDHAARTFTRADSLFGSLSPKLTCYDVEHYGLDLEIDPDHETISGEVTMSFEVLKATTEIRMDLLEFMTIDGITLDGQQLQFRRDLDAVFIAFDEGFMPRGNYELKIKYHGHPLEVTFGEIWAGGFMWSQDSEGNSFAQSLCQGYGAKGWWPVKNHLSDEPEAVDLKITVPAQLVAVGNGHLIHLDTLGDKHRYHWRATHPINSYDIAVHIGAYENASTFYDSSVGEDLDIQYFFLPQDQGLVEKNTEMVPKMLDVYEYYFGPYPFQEDGFKLVQSPYPMEHQSCVAVGPNFDEFLILHETAHEWWGNSVSITDNADIWINEAFATYAESLYVEATLGYDLGQKYINSRKSEILNDHPLVGLRNVNHFHYRIEDKYTKGSLMLNTMRHMVDNDELWFGTLKAVQEDFRHSFIDTESLINFMELQLEMDLSSFFTQYLRTTEVPTLELDEKADGLYYRWTNVVDDFHMPIRISERTIIPSTEWKNGVIEISENEIKQLMDIYLISVEVLTDE